MKPASNQPSSGSRSAPRPGGGFACGARLVLGWLALAPALLLADTRPVINARVVIPETPLTRDCDPAKLRECVEETTRRLQELGAEHFSYLNWNPGTGAGPAAANLTLELREFPEALGSAYALVLSDGSGAHTGGASLLPVYTANSLRQPTANAPKIKAQLLAVIAREFAKDTFRQHLQEEYLSNIAIASELRLAEAKQQFIVPVDCDELRMRQGSILAAKFRVSDGTTLAWATLILATNESDGDEPWYYQLRGDVKKFTCAPVSLDRWNDDLLEIWKKRVPGLDEVKVTTYIKETRPRRAGRLVTTHE